MKFATSLVLAAAAASYPPLATAQILAQAKAVTFNSSVARDEGGFRMCGVNLVVFDQLPDGAFDVYNFSINVQHGLFGGALKGGRYHAAQAELLPGRRPSLAAILPAPDRFWIAQEADGNPLMPKQFIESDVPGFFLAPGDMLASWKGIIDIVGGKRMQVNMGRQGDKYERVVAFAADPSQEDALAVMACLSGLGKRMAASAATK